MERLPRVKMVNASGNTKLLICFDNGVEKEYDCAPLMDRPGFSPLKDVGFFRGVKVDAGGYGISWNDNVDLSEYELWTNGRPRVCDTVGHLLA